MAGTKPLPTTECTLTLFITHLATSNVSLRTIKAYLAAIRHVHVCKGLHNHYNHQITPRLLLVLRGIKKRQAEMHFTKSRLPITIPILYNNTTSRWRCQKKPPSHDDTTFWAMCCTAFFGFLWVSEFTIPTEGHMVPPATYHFTMFRLITEQIPVYYNFS